jgi:hypothetical protein
MEKVINLKITKCEDCPYLQWNYNVDEKECALLDQLLFFDDYNNKDVKDSYSEPIIYKDCPLETSDGEKTEPSESNAILPDVIHWVKLDDKQPEDNQKCWCVDSKGDIYLCVYNKYTLFRKRQTFNNLIGKGWPVPNIVKWQPLILPCV